MIISMLDNMTLQVAGSVCYTWRDISNVELRRRQIVTKKKKKKSNKYRERINDLSLVKYDIDAKEVKDQMQLYAYLSECRKIRKPKDLRKVRFL